MKDFGEDMKIKFVQSQEQASVEISLGVVIFEGKWFLFFCAFCLFDYLDNYTQISFVSTFQARFYWTHVSDV